MAGHSRLNVTIGEAIRIFWENRHDLQNRSGENVGQATAVLDEVKTAYQSKIDAGTLTDVDRERIRSRLRLAADLEERSRSESSFSLLGNIGAAVKRFLKTGHWAMTREEYMQELRNLRELAETQLAGIHKIQSGAGRSS